MSLQDSDGVGRAADDVAGLGHPVSPQMAAGLAAIARARQALEDEFGMLSVVEAARQMGGTQPSSAYVDARREAGTVLGVPTRNTYAYPGFQFTGEGKVHPAVSAVLRATKDLDVDADTVAQWFCLPSAGLHGARPVDVIDDEQSVLADFTGQFGAQW